MTRGEAIKDFFYKTILPVAAVAARARWQTARVPCQI